MTSPSDRYAVIARGLLVSAVVTFVVALLIQFGVLPLDPEQRGLLATLLTVVGVVDIGVALFFRSRARSSQR